MPSSGPLAKCQALHLAFFLDYVPERVHVGRDLELLVVLVEVVSVLVPSYVLVEKPTSAEPNPVHLTPSLSPKLRPVSNLLDERGFFRHMANCVESRGLRQVSHIDVRLLRLESLKEAEL